MIKTTESKLTRRQVVKKLEAMKIADAVDFPYCNVLKVYEVRVYYNGKCIRQNARSLKHVLVVAEKNYCELVAESY